MIEAEAVDMLYSGLALSSAVPMHDAAFMLREHVAGIADALAEHTKCQAMLDEATEERDDFERDLKALKEKHTALEKAHKELEETHRKQTHKHDHEQEILNLKAQHERELDHQNKELHALLCRELGAKEAEHAKAIAALKAELAAEISKPKRVPRKRKVQ